jgi:hypothetical protein
MSLFQHEYDVAAVRKFLQEYTPTTTMYTVVIHDDRGQGFRLSDAAQEVMREVSPSLRPITGWNDIPRHTPLLVAVDEVMQHRASMGSTFMNITVREPLYLIYNSYGDEYVATPEGDTDQWTTVTDADLRAPAGAPATTGCAECRAHPNPNMTGCASMTGCGWI